MRGTRDRQARMLALFSIEARIPSDHPLRRIKAMADQELRGLSEVFDRMYSKVGRPAVAPEKILKSLLLMALYSVRSERQCCEQLGYNLLFRWFLDMELGEESFDATVFSKNQKGWIVYAKKPFGSPQTVLDYLGRYTHRVALSNDRILSLQNGQVTFTYRDRKDKDRLKSMPLNAQEFIRRFLLHVLPDGFMRTRHFGFLANRTKKHSLPQCRKLLGLNPALPEIPKRSAQDLLRELTGIDLFRCPLASSERRSLSVSCHRE